MTVRYREHMHANEPVHDWPLEELTALVERQRGSGACTDRRACSR